MENLNVTEMKTRQMQEAIVLDDIFWPLIQLNNGKETFDLMKAAFQCLIKEQPEKAAASIEALGKLSQVFLTSALNDTFICQKLEDNYTIISDYKKAEKADSDAYKLEESIK